MYADCGIVARKSEFNIVKVRIIDVDARDESLVRAIATMLVDGFGHNAPETFPNMATAVAEAPCPVTCAISRKRGSV